MMLKKINLVFIIALLIMFFSAFVYAQTSSGVTIISPDFIVVYDEFRQGQKTTDFDSFSNLELERINDMTLEKVSSGGSFEGDIIGRISWPGEVNLTEIHENKMIDLDQHFEISQNSVFVGTSYFTNLAKKVNISLYGISFANPRILRNGVVCPTSECVILNYTNEILEFSTVLGEEDYVFSAEETPVSPPSQGGNNNPGGGGGGSSSSSLANFSLDKNFLSWTVFPGERLRDNFLVINTGERGLLFDAGVFGEASKFILLSEKSFYLDEGNSNQIGISLAIPNAEKADIYTGSIDVEASSIHRVINVALKVVDNRSLFDLKSELNDLTLTKFQRISAVLTLTELSGLGEVEVDMEYFIKDFNGNLTKLGQEKLNVDKELIVSKSFELPEKLKTGDYVFYSRLTYENGVATTLNNFKVIDISWIYILFLALIILLICLFIFLIWYEKKRREQGKYGVFRFIPLDTKKIRAKSNNKNTKSKRTDTFT